MGLLDDKVVVVTGGASGIGAACAKTLAREGARVVVTDIDDRGGDETVKTITGAGGSAVYLHQDVTVEQHWVEIVEEIENRYRRLDVLISNAGISIGAQSIVEMTLSDWRRQTAINLDGVFLSVKHCLPPMRRSGGGSIVLMSSVAGLRGSPTLAGYCATKGGVRVFAKAVAMECAGANDGIRVNSVHPGIVDTPIWGKTSAGPTGMGHNSPTRAEQLAKAGVPLGFAGEPQDIADAVLFLASDAARYITGAEIVIDGGIMAGSAQRLPPQAN
jgi:NAD(P)-dependent dehydrogenase (short-subunit alcohol dehydrogenase family)